jgi:rRNA maturation protein Rpf1
MITTSRYASEKTRRLALGMARRLGQAYVARGKKTVDALADLARKAGDAGISIIEERGGAPERIAIIIVDELGRWRWAEERLLNSTEKGIDVEVSDEGQMRD